MDVTSYHEQTKHRFTGLAKGPDTLDWDAQPVAFRRFEECPQTLLPLNAERFELPFSSLFDTAAITPQHFNLESLSLLLELSMAVSAWKEYGTARWAIRCNPSSGNLHPTEAYLVPLGIDGIDDGLYHYRADTHSLEQRCRIEQDTQQDTLLIGLSSIHWREAWKYGERAYRYCQLDVGHAVASLSYAAAALGWRITRHEEVGDTALAQLLGIDRREDYPRGSEQEHPDLLLSLQPQSGTAIDTAALLKRLECEHWCGRANVLDRRHFYQWPIIDEVSRVAERPAGGKIASAQTPTLPLPLPQETTQGFAPLVRSRRSAQAFDGQTAISSEALYRTLDHLLPRESIAPWGDTAWPPLVHPLLFIHRVEGLKAGLYALPRRPGALGLMQNAMDPAFEWESVNGAPQHLPLYRLATGKVEGIAIKLSCGQSIAGQSAFSMAMLAEFSPLVEDSPWRYRELHWEAGAMGQVLYLEAEANGLQGTGIGCFFDDGLHELLGLQGHELQVLYHFTVGGAVRDDRITTLPAYDR